jgi:hypothetical protein
MFDFHGNQSFRKDVGYHFFSRTVNKPYFTIFNDPLNEMETDVDVFCASMVLVFLSKGNSGLIVREKGSRIECNTEDLQNELAKTESLLCCVGSGNVFALGSGQ